MVQYNCLVPFSSQVQVTQSMVPDNVKSSLWVVWVQSIHICKLRLFLLKSGDLTSMSYNANDSRLWLPYLPVLEACSPGIPLQDLVQLPSAKVLVLVWCPLIRSMEPNIPPKPSQTLLNRVPVLLLYGSGPFQVVEWCVHPWKCKPGYL